MTPSPTNPRDEAAERLADLMSRANTYLNGGGALGKEYASDILRDFYDFHRRTPSLTPGAVTREAMAEAMAEKAGMIWPVLPDEHDMVCGHGMPEGCRSYWRGLADAILALQQAEPDKGEPVAWREIEMMRLINVLRADEGDSVEILCDNPDFNDQPNCAIVCCGDWTGWLHKRFAADALLDTLSMAVTERNLPSPREVIATSNGHHWIKRFNLVCCRDCGFVRRADDQNSPCKGSVGVGIRRDLLPASPQASPDVRESEPDWKQDQRETSRLPPRTGGDK